MNKKRRSRKRKYYMARFFIWFATFAVMAVLVVFILWIYWSSFVKTDYEKSSESLVYIQTKEDAESVSEMPSISLDEKNSESILEETLEEKSSKPELDIQAGFADIETISLGNSLEITDIGSYTGIYMEDGSDDVVSGIQMIIVKNTSEKDLQYAEINLIYESVTAEFEVSNLPAGTSAVLLEQNRYNSVSEKPISSSADHVVFFPEKMDLKTEQLEISGMKGALNVKNISGKDFLDDIYIYYKNSAEDLFYGGITYRAKIEGRFAANELKQVITGHYSPETCTILMVTGVE